jgi:DNA-binding NarL/FixJ family response regulator
MTELLLVDDHASFREALAFMLDREPDLSVVAQAGTVGEAIACDAPWSLAVVDLGLPDGPGSDLVESLFERVPEARIVVLTASSRPAELASAYEAGAAGVVQKTAGIGRWSTRATWSRSCDRRAGSGSGWQRGGRSRAS